MNVNYMCQDLFGAAEQYAYNIPILLYPELEPEQGTLWYKGSPVRCQVERDYTTLAKAQGMKDVKC